MELSDRGGTPRRRVKFLTPTEPDAAALPDVRRRVTFLARHDRQLPSPAPYAGEEESSAPSGEIAYQLSSGSRVRVVASRYVCQSVLAHASESRDHGAEVGGILVGYHDSKQRVDGTSDHLAIVTDIIPVRSEDSSHSHVAFDTECWNYVDQQMETQFSREGKFRLGWYHTHPTQGLFFSKHDRDAHSVFTQPHQFAMVVDPRTSEAAVFFWSNHAARELGGPVRFPLQGLRPDPQPLLPSTTGAAQEPATRFPAAASAPVKWDNVLAFAAAAVLTAGSVVYKAYDGKSSLDFWDFCLLGSAASIGLICSKFGLFGGQAGANTPAVPWVGRGFAAGAALVVLTFISGVRWPGTEPVQIASVSRPATDPAGGFGRAQFPAQAETRPIPADAGVSKILVQNAEKELRFDVNRLVRGRNVRVAVSSADLPAAVSYSLAP